MKRKIVCALSILLLLAVITATTAMANQSDITTSNTTGIMHLTPNVNPADPKQIEEIDEAIKNGNVMNAVPLNTPKVMHLTPDANPVTPKQIEEIDEAIKNGNVMNAEVESLTGEDKI